MVGDPCTNNDIQKQPGGMFSSEKFFVVDPPEYEVINTKECLEFYDSLGEKVEDGTAASEDGNSNSSKLSKSSKKGKKQHHKKHHSKRSCTVAYRKAQLSSSLFLRPGGPLIFIDGHSVFGPVTSRDEKYLETYLSRQDVREILHVTDAASNIRTTWTFCYPDVSKNYVHQYNACSSGEVEFPHISMLEFYREIVPKLEKTWIINGDTDAGIIPEGTRKAVRAIGFPETSAFRPWFYNQTGTPLAFIGEKSINFGTNLVAWDLESPQFGGEVVNYEGGLLFATVHGSGHLIPRDRPQQSLHLVKKLLVGSSDDGLSSLLSPSLPSDEELAKYDPSMSLDAQLQNYVEWTKLAKGDSYINSNDNRDISPPSLVLS